MKDGERIDQILAQAFRMASKPKMVWLINFASKSRELHTALEEGYKKMDKIAAEIAEEECSS